ncbi:MAG: PPOX class F420-dependent oxidoreductase [Myxococcota bacterium]|nr:PPOX class F420-dependent oxidoreductase [Myxococcota bacterium]
MARDVAEKRAGRHDRSWRARYTPGAALDAEKIRYFASLDGERHMSLATFRATGEPVPTPIWFAEVGGRLYVRTASHFKKLERISRTPRVTVAPCTETGDVTGAPFPAVARILSPGDPAIAAAESALEARYPDSRPAMTQLMADNGWTGVYVEIGPPSGGGVRSRSGRLDPV